MKTETEIREEIQRILKYREKWPCFADVQRECDVMVQMLQWVLEEEEDGNSK